MSFLPRSGSLAKLVGVLAVVAAMACTGIWYMTSQMQRIDASYARFLDREARAWVAAPRLRSSLVYFQSLVYRIIAETTDDAMKALVPQFDRTAEEALRFAAIIRENAPAYEQEVAAIEGGLKTLREEAKPIIEMALDSAYDKGLALAHQRVNPVIETGSGNPRRSATGWMPRSRRARASWGSPPARRYARPGWFWASCWRSRSWRHFSAPTSQRADARRT
jgi:hypothetical protein